MMFMEKSTLIVSMVALLAACSKTGNEGEKPYSYKAAITVTEYGIPHITANDYASLGFGEGYMAAKDHICNISFNIIAANGETSKYLGNGPKNRYLRQNSVTRALGIPEKSQIAFKNQSADIQDMYKGYAAGFNKFLKEEENTSWCKGASWVKPVTAIDLFSQVTYIVQTLPRMAGALYTASPPSEEQISTSAEREELLLASEAALHLNGMGSNAWAFGKEMSENGRGMLLANPHYPWFGTNRFWEKHLTIPGKMDVYGVSLIGGPGVVIGFNQDIGWTHTVSASQRVVIYKLDLVEGDPTSYIFDGEVRKMTSRDVNIMVRKEDGTLEQETKTFWSSHHGPIAIFRDLEWTDKNAYAVRDANRDNMYTVAQWFDMSRATSMDNLETALKKWNAMPWVNAIATGKEGKAAYFDNSVVGNLSNEAMDLWQKQYDSDDLTKSLYDQRSMTLLNGSDSRFDWVDDGGSLTRETVAYENKPKIIRDDYVFNANDSYWLTTPREPLSGYSPLYGSTDKQRSLRTRMNIMHLEDETTRGDDGKYSLQEIQQTLLSNMSLAYEVYKTGITNMCETPNTVELDGTTVALDDACNVIANYNGRLDLESNGAVLFREWILAYNSLTDRSDRFETKFTADDPYKTPNGLGDIEAARKALAMAILVIQKSGNALDVALGELQKAYRGSVVVPIHGGFGFEGVANVIVSGSSNTSIPMEAATSLNDRSSLTDKGYLVGFGSSFIMSLEYTDDGPNAQAVLTYGQSGNPQAENYSDQTKLFSQKKWRNIYFKKSDVNNNAVTSFTLVSE